MKYTALIVALLCVLFALPFASAAVSVSNVDLTVNQAVERSNPVPERSDSLLDDTSELSYVTFSIPVTATGQQETVTSITPNLNGFSYDQFGNNLNTSYQYRVDTTLPLTIAAGTTQNVVLRVLVPSNLNAIDNSFNRVKNTISANIVTSAGTQSPSLSFYVENNLQLKKVTIIQGSDSYKCKVNDNTVSLDCDNDLDQLRPGEAFDLEFTVKNTHTDNSQLDLSGISINIDSDNSDIDTSDDSFDEDISTSSDQQFTVNYDVDSGVEDGDDARITIEADVDDDNNAHMGFSHSFDIGFNTEDYDLATPTLSVAPSAACPGDSIVLSYNIENIGSKKQSNVRPVFLNDALGLNKIMATVSLDAQGDRYDTNKASVSYTLPAKAKAGSYPIQLQVYYKDQDTNDALLTNSATLTVQNCVDGTPGGSTSTSGSSTSGTSGSTSGTQTSGGIVVVQPGQTGTVTANGGQTTPVTGGASVPVRAVVADNSDTPYLVGLGIGLVVLLVVVGLLIAAITRK